MEPIQYNWDMDGRGHSLLLAFVGGTHGHPYLFGEGRRTRPIEIHDFLVGTVPVTQALWTHVTGTNANPKVHRGEDLPVDNVSWDDITRPGGFLERINDSPACTEMS